MLITKQQVLAAMAATGMAMTVASSSAHANGEGDDRVQYGPTEMDVDMSAGSDTDTLRPRPPTDLPLNRGEADEAPTREHGNFPFERVVIQKAEQMPIFIAERLVRPMFGYCVLTPREIFFPYLITPNTAARCPR